MAGLAAGKTVEFAPVPWLLGGALASAGLAVAAAWRWPGLWAPALCGAMVLGGWASYTLHRQRLPDWDRLPPREVRLALRLDRVFPPTDPRKVSGLATVARAEGHLRALAGQRLYFSLTLRAGETAPLRSTVVTAMGVLAPVPRDPPADSFDGYLDDAGINFRLSRGRVLGVGQPPTRYRVFCEHAAERLNVILSLGIAGKRPELAAVFRAMMLGQKHELSDEQDTLFMHSGTMHLFAINGLHIGVVAIALRALLAVLRCPRPAAALVTLAVLWLDVDTTGASPSAVRAFLLVACHEMAPVLRRPANGLAALSLAALLVLLAEPMALFSASFQMSYGVVAVILGFGLPLAERLETRWKPYQSLPPATWSWRQRRLVDASRWLAGALGIGVAATLVSAVTGATFFHVLAPAGLVANLVLVPLASLVIIAGFASVTAGLAGAAALSTLFNHAAALLLWLIAALIRLGLHVPGAWWPVAWRYPWIAPAALLTLIAVVLTGYASGWRRERGGFWPPFVVTALALVFGVRFG
jgi:competence protein ComEC